MQWIYSIKPKYKAALILAVVFVLVLGNNILSKQNVTHLGSSFSEVYEDRLLVESYIFKLSDLLYRKKIILDKTNSAERFAGEQNQLAAYNKEINNLLLSYEKTKLTARETLVFQSLKDNISEMRLLEKSLLLSLPAEIAQARRQFDNTFSAAAANLNQLSQIQVSEGEILNEESKKSIAGFTMHTQFEMALLVLLGLLIQGIIFSSKAIVPKTAQKHSLN